MKFEKRKTKEGLEVWVSGLGEDAEVNTVLSEKLRLEFGIQLPAFESGSIEAYLGEVAALSPKSVTWRVRRQVVFGVFPSARMAMYHDLNTQTAEFGINEIIRPLFGGGGSAASSPFADEYLVDDPEVERKVPCLVLPADSSQFSTLVDIATGMNVAVEGPPGTGKSQTIVNAIASALAAGKKVLFVAEKMAALDVVRSRLEAIELGEFLLPLQAERSTREIVVQSIRDRLEMESVPLAQHYDDQVAQFRSVRDEMALYVATLSQKFEESGLTVHEILGKSVATGDRLADLPKTMQLGQFPIRHRLTVALITELARKGKLLEAAWEKASACSSFWKGVRIVALSRFDAEEIVELAESHASCLERLDEKFRAADRVGITGVKLPDKLSELVSILENALAVEPSHLTLVPLAATVEASEALRVFLADCQEFESIEMSVGRFIPGEVTAATLDAVAELERICIEHGIEDLDVDTLGRSVSSKREVIAMARKLATQMRPFADLVPGSEHWRFSDVGKVRELATRAGRNVLHGRSHVTADPAAPELLKKLNEIGRQLQHDRAALSVHFSFAEVTPHEVIAEFLRST